MTTARANVPRASTFASKALLLLAAAAATASSGSYFRSSSSVVGFTPGARRRHRRHCAPEFGTASDERGCVARRAQTTVARRRLLLRSSVAGDDDSSAIPPAPATAESLLDRARSCLSSRNPDGAFAALYEAYGVDPTDRSLPGLFESCLRLRIDVLSSAAKTSDISQEDARSLIQDRFGLASLLIDAERYDEASEQLRAIVGSSDNGGTMVDDDVDVGSSDDDGGGGAAAGTAAKVADEASMERASAMLYRTNAACCSWNTYGEDGSALSRSLDRYFVLRQETTTTQDDVQECVPVLHPFNALKFPCVNLTQATGVAAAYARRAERTVGLNPPSLETMLEYRRRVTAMEGGPIRVTPASDEALLRRRRAPHGDVNGDDGVIRVGYLSPDFTAKHPLAFLMRDVFRFHDRSAFEVHVYSLSGSEDDDGSPEVDAVQSGSDTFVSLHPSLGGEAIVRRIESDELDVLIDLCGYAGSSQVAEVMACRRCAPIQVSYMGFPGSSGASYIDYAVFDPVVVPHDVPQLRGEYTESMIYMPHCYFVNSHRHCATDALLSTEERTAMREKYGLPRDCFVYCCHSRPDKIDPSTFRTWLRALERVNHSENSSGGGEHARPPKAVLWLLRSGPFMEHNLRSLTLKEFGPDVESSLRFCDVAPRDEHLRRLGAADLFLDTPAYGAHTVGCDALWAGVPLISLLRPTTTTAATTTTTTTAAAAATEGAPAVPLVVDTDKLASRVGASLLYASGIGEDMVVPTLDDYADLMVRCAEEADWYDGVRERLRRGRDVGDGDGDEGGDCEGGNGRGEGAACAPLFDTERWVRNLERGLRRAVWMPSEGASADGESSVVNGGRGVIRRDILILDE